MTDFLSRIELADPYASDLSEDDTGASWGHYQFTAGNMMVTSVLQSWDAVGTTEMAHKFIAASIKTCKVARHICFEQGIKTGSYLSDAYLQNLVETLWKLWKQARGPGVGLKFLVILIIVR